MEISLVNRLYAKRNGVVSEVLSWQLWQTRYFDPYFGGAVAPGAALWDIYPSFLDARYRDEFLRVFHGGTPASIR